MFPKLCGLALTLGASLPFGLTISELALLAVAIAYAMSLLRDWRPMRQLRDENKGLRADLEREREKAVKLAKDLEARLRATDLSALQAEHSDFAKLIAKQTDVLDRLAKEVGGLTTAVEFVGKGEEIRQALTQGDKP